MELIGYLFKQRCWQMLLISIATIIAGLSSAGLAMIIGSALDADNNARSLLAFAFFSLCFVHIVAKSASDIALLRITQSIIVRLRVELSNKLIATPQKKLQEIGNDGLMVILTGDIGSFAGAFQILPAIVSHIVVIAACLMYTAWISWQILAVITLTMIICIGGFYIAERTPLRQLLQAREMEEELFKSFDGLVYGSRELQLNKQRATHYVDKILGERSSSLSTLFVKAISRYTWTNNIGNILFYQGIAIVLFALPLFSYIETATVVSATVVMLYIVRPIGELMMIMPNIRQANISLNKILELDKQLDPNYGTLIKPDPFGEKIESLRLSNICFSYCDSKEETFKLGPITLDIVPNEILFIVGGNGSGKSSLAMLLLGLHSADSGKIILNGCELNSSNSLNYRQKFSAIFSDGHLFQQLPSTDEGTSKCATEFIDLMGLSGKVAIKNNEFTTTNLSTGQKKRLALVSSYIEDRPIYIFDEWAAAQDPEFKKVFYRDLLPDLKRNGKTVIVITHDDTYFEYSDRTIKLQDGVLVDSFSA